VNIISTNESIINFSKLFEDYNTISIEQSAKIIHTVNKDRILFKFYTKEISFSQVLFILNELKFPNREVARVEKAYPASDYLIFSLDTETFVYRIYFETLISKQAPLNERHLSLSSIKWEYYNPTKVQHTIYYSILIDRISTMIEEATKCDIYKLPVFAYEEINRMLAKDVIHFYSVEDEETDRKSICIPFNRDTVFLKDVENLNDIDLQQSLKEFKDFPIQHIQMGKDKDSNIFYTLYFSILRKLFA
jgi:hypothetical protein